MRLHIQTNTCKILPEQGKQNKAGLSLPPLSGFSFVALFRLVFQFERRTATEVNWKQSTLIDWLIDWLIDYLPIFNVIYNVKCDKINYSGGKLKKPLRAFTRQSPYLQRITLKLIK